MLIGSTLTVAIFGLHNHRVEVLGGVPRHAPRVGLYGLSWSALQEAAPIATVVALVVVSQSAATTRAFADQHGYEVDVDRDFTGVGAGNVMAGLCGAFRVKASPPRSAARIGLDAIARLTPDTTRRDNITADPDRSQMPRETVPRRPRLVTARGNAEPAKRCPHERRIARDGALPHQPITLNSLDSRRSPVHIHTRDNSDTIEHGRRLGMWLYRLPPATHDDTQHAGHTPSCLDVLALDAARGFRR